MTEPLITILTVNYNTSDFIELMLYALRKLTLNSYRVLICDNGSKNRDVLKLVKIAGENDNVELIYRRQTEPGSKAHGEALDILTEKVDTRYTAILDSDCSFLLKNWDKKLIDKIDDDVKIVGSTSPSNRLGLRVGGGAFPLPFAVLFETNVYGKLEIHCVPGDAKKGEDTCWQWKSKFLEAGYSGKVLTAKNTRDFKDIVFSGLTGVENYYTDKGELIASHFGRGSCGGAPKYFKWLKIPIVSRHVKRCYANIEKKKWISKCYEIINEQL